MILINLLLYTLLSSKVFASEPVYFDYSHESIPVDNKISVSFIHKLGEVPLERFLVRPVSEGVGVSALGDSWIDSGSSWTLLPHLSDVVELMFSEGFYSTKLCFEVLDTVTGVVYKTPSHRVIGRSWFVNYVGRLNENVLRW